MIATSGTLSFVALRAIGASNSGTIDRHMTDPKLRVLISSEQIQNRIRELGEKISADYPTGNLHMICILKGAVFFMTDLARAMKRDVQLDFMGISTYGKGKTSSGEVKVTKDLDI